MNPSLSIAEAIFRPHAPGQPVILFQRLLVFDTDKWGTWIGVLTLPIHMKGIAAYAVLWEKSLSLYALLPVDFLLSVLDPARYLSLGYPLLSFREGLERALALAGL